MKPWAERSRHTCLLIASIFALILEPERMSFWTFVYWKTIHGISKRRNRVTGLKRKCGEEGSMQSMRAKPWRRYPDEDMDIIQWSYLRLKYSH